jgi:hypothetical protein
MDKALQTMIDNMPEKTGKSLDDWTKILAKKGFAKHMEAVKFLKTVHGVTHGFANTIVTLSKDSSHSDADLLANQYKGKEELKPIYEELVKLVKSFGDDVTVTPKKTSVSLIRKKQFALIKPATKTRIDLGIKLKDVAVTDRLENSGPFGSMCTHRVRLHTEKELDQMLTDWLLEAYEKAN